MICCPSGEQNMQNAAKAIYHKLFLKINRLSSQLAFAYSTLYEVEKERVGVPVKRGLYENIVGELEEEASSGATNCYEQLEFPYRKEVRCLSLESGAEEGFNPLGFLQVPGISVSCVKEIGLHDLLTGEGDTWLSVISLCSPLLGLFAMFHYYHKQKN
ncbi:hypothetical protein YC2023_046191 [Brassica napus]